MGKRNRLMNMQRHPAPNDRTRVQAEAQSSGDAESAVYYVHGPNGIHAQQEAVDWKWFAKDGLRSVRNVLSSNSEIQQSQNFDPFGNKIDSLGSQQTTFGYTGELTDENNLVYLRNRYYSPQPSTFTSQDQIEGNTDNSQSLNQYAYVDGNPVNRTDPSGQFSIPRSSMAFAGRAGLAPVVSHAAVTGTTDSLAVLKWVNNVINGCDVQQSPTPTFSGNVFVPCDAASVNARSHPSFYGSIIGSYVGGTVFTNCEERADSPTAGGPAPANWVRVATDAAGCATSQDWIRRTDGARQLLQDGSPQSCASQMPSLVPAAPTQPGSFKYGSPGCIRGGTCVTGDESAEYQVGFVLACEAAAGGYTDTTQIRQAMVDIAYVIRARMRAGGFPDTALDVIRQTNAFQCYTEGSSSDLTMTIGQSSRIAEALVYNTPLPPPSFPQLEYALFFFGLPWQGQANSPANSIPRQDVLRFFTNADNQLPLAIVGVPYGTLDGIYLGHGPTNSLRFGTFFFSDDPAFTGFIP